MLSETGSAALLGNLTLINTWNTQAQSHTDIFSAISDVVVKLCQSGYIQYTI